MRLLGIDVGARKIGVAAGTTLAEELTTLRLKKPESYYEPTGGQCGVAEIKKLLEQEDAKGIVVGLPVDKDGKETEESGRIRIFADILKAHCEIPIYFVDETLTSCMARDILESQGVSGRELSSREDQLSAQLILQQYLEEHALS